MNTIRTFVALNLPVTTVRKVAAMQADLRQRAAAHEGLEVGWVRAPNMHVTLKFLGNMPEEAAWLVRDKFTTALDGHHPLRLHLRGLGAFPSAEAPRVLWLGLEQQDQQLTDLAGAVDSWLEELGFEKEQKPFSPHLTLGRVRKGSAAALLAEPELAEIDLGPCTAGDVVFYRSVLQQKGAEYTPLARIKLVRPAD